MSTERQLDRACGQFKQRTGHDGVKHAIPTDILCSRLNRQPVDKRLTVLSYAFAEERRTGILRHEGVEPLIAVGAATALEAGKNTAGKLFISCVAITPQLVAEGCRAGPVIAQFIARRQGMAVCQQDGVIPL